MCCIFTNVYDYIFYLMLSFSCTLLLNYGYVHSVSTCPCQLLIQLSVGDILTYSSVFC